MISRQRLAALIDETNTENVAHVFRTVAYASHLTGDQEELNPEYYIRHRIETIKRIQLTAKTDALALVQLLDIDYDAARQWSRYLAEELNHDRLYLADLHCHGLTDKQVAGIVPFPSTQRMLSYLTDRIQHLGPLPAIAYSVFTEWNSARGSAAVVAKAERRFSERHVSGSKAHLGIDVEEDHYEAMVHIAHRLVARLGEETILMRLLSDIADLFGEYFQDLYDHTREVGTLTEVAR